MTPLTLVVVALVVMFALWFFYRVGYIQGIKRVQKELDATYAEQQAKRIRTGYAEKVSYAAPRTPHDHRRTD